MVRDLNFLIRYFSNYYTLHRSDLAARTAPLDPRLWFPILSLYVKTNEIWLRLLDSSTVLFSKHNSQMKMMFSKSIFPLEICIDKTFDFKVLSSEWF